MYIFCGWKSIFTNLCIYAICYDCTVTRVEQYGFILCTVSAMIIIDISEILYHKHNNIVNI